VKAAYSGHSVPTNPPLLWIWKEVIGIDMAGDVSADLCAIGQRVEKVQAGPDSGVVHFVQHAVQVGVSSLRLDYFRNSGLIRRQRPTDVAGAEESRD